MSGSRQTRPLLYPVRQLHHVCRVDAEEDVKDFRPLRPGLDPPEIVVLFLCPERAFHRIRHHSGKLLSDKVFLLFSSHRTDGLFLRKMSVSRSPCSSPYFQFPRSLTRHRPHRDYPINVYNHSEKRKKNHHIQPPPPNKRATPPPNFHSED